MIALALRFDRRLRNLGGALQQVPGVRSLLRCQVGVDRRPKACGIPTRGRHRVGEMLEESPETSARVVRLRPAR